MFAQALRNAVARWAGGRFDREGRYPEWCRIPAEGQSARSWATAPAPWSRECRHVYQGVFRMH
ncbi:hypothetical protein ACIRS1_05530 [Kitasatospora sp. NPDC101176]|uniref:hypothetical protein n=1 Tax=Kitasatospora sp. NPDC101176 TaxID=3364099 RepID=UPI0037FF837C